MLSTEISLRAHLMRRAGFGVNRKELEELAKRDYDSIVDDLIHPERFESVDEDVVERYTHGRPRQWDWIYWMVTTKRSLEEKMTLLYHHIFATANYKSDNPQASYRQIEMFRSNAMGKFGDMLLKLSRDPAMLFWLDNNENHKNEPNENYGRELLELFSMGVGNYNENDVKAAAYSFTGWTFTTNIPGKIYPSFFKYIEDDHDASQKSFLGHVGNLDGQDIVDIISCQPAAAIFLSRHLYNFFVADEPPVSSWNEIPPNDPEAIQILVRSYFESEGDLRHILKVLFTSDFFKNSQFKRVKSPAELVTGLIKLTDCYQEPEPWHGKFGGATGLMGQSLMNPLTVEGWLTGQSWIDGGTLNERINFAVNQIADANNPGFKDIVARLKDKQNLSAEEFVETCLDLVGPLEVSKDTRVGLVAQAATDGDLVFNGSETNKGSVTRISRMLQLIVATREYQFA